MVVATKGTTTTALPPPMATMSPKGHSAYIHEDLNQEEEKLPKAATPEPPTTIEPPSVPIVDVPSPFSGLLEGYVDSRSIPFKGGEDAVSYLSMRPTT